MNLCRHHESLDVACMHGMCISILEFSCTIQWAFWLGVGCFCRWHLSCTRSVGCMIGGSVHVWTKDILY